MGLSGDSSVQRMFPKVYWSGREDRARAVAGRGPAGGPQALRSVRLLASCPARGFRGHAMAGALRSAGQPDGNGLPSSAYQFVLHADCPRGNGDDAGLQLVAPKDQDDASKIVQGRRRPALVVFATAGPGSPTRAKGSSQLCCSVCSGVLGQLLVEHAAARRCRSGPAPAPPTGQFGEMPPLSYQVAVASTVPPASMPGQRGGLELDRVAVGGSSDHVVGRMSWWSGRACSSTPSTRRAISELFAGTRPPMVAWWWRLVMRVAHHPAGGRVVDPPRVVCHRR